MELRVTLEYSTSSSVVTPMSVTIMHEDNILVYLDLKEGEIAVPSLQPLRIDIDTAKLMQKALLLAIKIAEDPGKELPMHFYKFA